MGGRRWLLIIWVAALTFSSRAFAFDQGRGGEVARTVVLLVRGPASEARALLDSVKELLGRLGLSVVTSDSDKAPLATVSVVLRDSECVVTVAKEGRMGSGSVAELRRLPRQPSTAVTLEAVAHIIQASVEQLLALARATAEVPRAPSALTAETVAGEEASEAEPPLPGGPTMRVEALLSGVSVGSAVPIVAGAGLGASLGVPLSPRVAWGLRVGAAYAGPGIISQALVISTVHCTSSRLAFLLRYAPSTRFEFAAGVAGGADILITSNDSTSAELAPYVVHTTVAPSAVLGATVEVGVRVARWVQVLVRLSGDLDLNPRIYTVNVGATRTVLLQPWVLRPTLSLGVSFEVWSAG